MLCSVDVVHLVIFVAADNGFEYLRDTRVKAVTDMNYDRLGVLKNGSEIFEAFRQI